MSALALVEGARRSEDSFMHLSLLAGIQPTSEGMVFPGSEKASKFPVDTQHNVGDGDGDGDKDDGDDGGADEMMQMMMETVLMMLGLLAMPMPTAVFGSVFAVWICILALAISYGRWASYLSSRL